MSEISIVPASLSHRRAFLKAVDASKELHRGWVMPPQNASEYDAYVTKYSSNNHLGYLVTDANNLVGVVNVSEIVMGIFRSGFLGYYVFNPYSGSGNMKLGLSKVISRVFSKHGLNRVEANIQPENLRSIGLVKSLGFRKEGFSERYLRIDGEWKDHERWAVHRREWLPSGAA